MEHFTPSQWVLIDLANQYGLDNVVFAKRLGLGREILEDIKQNNHQQWVDKAENPALFTKAVCAIQDILNQKETGFMMGLDVCNSGAALLSVLLHCETGMRNTGLINTGVRPDGYALITDNMEGVEVERKEVKTATVPYMYGSDFKPIQVFGEDLFPVYEDAYAKVFPEAYWARKTLINAFDYNALFHEFELPNGFKAHIECRGLSITKGKIGDYTFSYLHKENRTLEKGEQGTKSLVANVTHGFDGFVVAEMDYRCNYNVNQTTKAIAALEGALAGEEQSQASEEFIHLNQLAKRFNFVSAYAVEHIVDGRLGGLDKGYLKKLLDLFKAIMVRPSFQVLSVHDEFKCMPNYVQSMREVYNWIMADSYKSTWLLDVIYDLTGDQYEWDEPTKGNIYSEILNNDYNLC